MARVSAMEVDDEIDELIIASCYINAISATAVLNYYVITDKSSMNLFRA
jgi:hypothetical protein